MREAGKPFRIVVADDKEEHAVNIKNGILASVNARGVTPSVEIWNLRYLMPFDGLGSSPDVNSNTGNLPVHIATEFSSNKGAVQSNVELVYSHGDTEIYWKDELLFSADVLVLDMNMPCANEYMSDIPAGTTSDGDILNGERFLAWFREKLESRYLLSLPVCKQIIIYTAHTESTISAHNSGLDSMQTPSRPFRINFYGKGETQAIVEIISDLFMHSLANYSLTNWYDSAFAATHDMPVLILGESGTGKEKIAERIHDNWRANKIRSNPSLEQVISEKPVTINCAGLSETLARSELFGAVKGSYTGSVEHIFGKFLWACSPKKSKEIRNIGDVPAPIERALDVIKQYRKKLLELERDQAISDPEKIMSLFTVLGGQFNIEGERVEPNVNRAIDGLLASLEKAAKAGSGGDYKNSLKKWNNFFQDVQGSDYNIEMAPAKDLDGEVVPRGTVILDEFGDLPAGVQTLLLRYLQDFEICPLGYPGIIKNARVRIIAATSDPTVAQMVGESLQCRQTERNKEREFMREDLVFRLKGQVIRVEPISEKNVQSELEFFIKEFVDVPWSKEAVDFVVEQVRDLTSFANGDKNKIVGLKKLFGHRRELKQLVTIVAKFMRNAKSFGVPTPSSVTREIVEMMWKPSVISPVEQEAESRSPKFKSFVCGLTSITIDIGTAQTAVSKMNDVIDGKLNKIPPAYLCPNKEKEKIKQLGWPIDWEFGWAYILIWYYEFYQASSKDNNKEQFKLVFEGENYNNLLLKVQRMLEKLQKEKPHEVQIHLPDSKDIKNIYAAKFKQWCDSVGVMWLQHGGDI